MKYSIVQADMSHLNDVAQLFNAYRVFYKQEDDIYGATSFISDRLIDGSSSIFLALSKQDEPLGFTQLYPSFTSVGMNRIFVLNDLFVNENARKFGIATALISAAQKFGKSNGAVRLALETEQSNFNAQALYEKLGWIREEGMYHYTVAL